MSNQCKSDSTPCCQKCGERIRGTPRRWGIYKWLCGLCYDDILNVRTGDAARN